MCGIAGCILTNGEAAPILNESLKRLEYRGYDSVGHATIHNGRLIVRKDKGKVDEVAHRLRLRDMEGSIGIGHTRWATHGAPSMENAHPLTDCKDRVAVVHNGIIENFIEFRRSLEKNGHQFKSRTDSEIIAHLVEEKIEQGASLTEAVRRTANELKGAYAVAIISSSEPDKLIAAKTDSPLVLGPGSGGNYCASDTPAFLPYTNKTIVLEDGEMAVLTATSIQLIQTETGKIIHRNPTKTPWTLEAAQRGGFPHFMLKEINEQPESLRNALRVQSAYIKKMASMILEAQKVFFVGCGTSYHACLAGSFAFARLAQLSTQAVIASEFLDCYGSMVDRKTAVLAVSQSGETADTLQAIKAAKDKGAKVLGITNVMGSSITRVSEAYLGQNSGPELGVAATKTFTSQVAILLRLALATSRARQPEDVKEIQKIELALKEAPRQVETILTNQHSVQSIARKYRDRESFCFLGRGANVATAMEGRLKLLELSYIPAIAYPAGESKHGFISVVEPGYPVVFLAPRDESHSKMIGNIMEMKARGASIIAIGENEDSDIKEHSEDYIEMPQGIPSVLAPILYAVPLQLMAYFLAVEKGHNPDYPRNLAKSVTVQ